MTDKQKQETLANEAQGRKLFDSFNTQQTNWEINKWSKDFYSSWDVSYTSGSTQDFIIGEIKYRNGYASFQFPDWVLEQKKLLELQRIKGIIQKKYPNKKVFIHYINFYRNTDKPRIWDITNLKVDFDTLRLPYDSVSTQTYYKDKQATYLHNNDALTYKQIVKIN
jgi:hypothetical protein